MNCKVCNGLIKDIDFKSSICINCKIMYNKETKELDYSDGGGQGYPSKSKSLLRYKNAKIRFEIFKYFIKKNSLFIDIGCGSGEMMDVSKKYTEYQIGFDTNSTLEDCRKEKMLEVISEYYNKALIPSNYLYQRQKVYSISHVLEHIEEPFNILTQLFDDMNSGDILYIEVPLYTGYSFQKFKYDWPLWYDEHLNLYSLETLNYMAKKLGFNVLDVGYRNFISDSSKRKAFKLFCENMLLFISRWLTKKKYHSLLDNYLRDYGFIVLEKR